MLSHMRQHSGVCLGAPVPPPTSRAGIMYTAGASDVRLPSVDTRRAAHGRPIWAEPGARPRARPAMAEPVRRAVRGPPPTPTSSLMAGAGRPRLILTPVSAIKARSVIRARPGPATDSGRPRKIQNKQWRLAAEAKWPARRGAHRPPRPNV